MKSILLVLLSISLFSRPADADDAAPSFLKTGSTYWITIATSGYPPQGSSIPSPVTILAHGGGSWFRVAYRTGAKPDERTAEQWINFAHITTVNEVPDHLLSEFAPRVSK